MITDTSQLRSARVVLLGATLAVATFAAAVATFAATALTSHPASAITAELAKKCEALVSTAFPPRQIGNPAAGSAKGNSKAQRDYYRKCVANDGKMDAGEKK